MLKEKFGLAEAKELEAKHKKADWPTVKAVLAVVGVVNKVKEEAEAEAAALMKDLGEIKARISVILNNDAKDIKESEARIRKERTDRRTRALDNIRAVNSGRSDLERKEESVRGLAK